MADKKEYIKMGIILNNGGRVELEVESGLWESDIFNSLDEAIRGNNFFNEDGWNDLTMKYKGNTINVLDCSKVIGLQF